MAGDGGDQGGGDGPARAVETEAVETAAVETTAVETTAVVATTSVSSSDPVAEPVPTPWSASGCSVPAGSSTRPGRGSARVPLAFRVRRLVSLSLSNGDSLR